MTKAAFMNELAYKLRVLPESERRDALDYYEGYFNDASDDASALAQLGSPGEVAAMILAEAVTMHQEEHGWRKHKVAWALIIGFFALPVGLPLIITAMMIPFSLFIVVATLIFSFGIAGVASIAAGIFSVITALFIFTQDVGYGLISMGMGLVAIGIGILCMKLAIICTGGFTWVARYAARKIKNRNKKDRSDVYEPQRLQ